MLLIKVSITVFGAKVQHSITGKTKATITSINGFGVEASAVLGFIVFGGLAQWIGMANALMVIGAATASIGALYMLFTRGHLLRR